jgi:hypothetical protein
MFLLGCIPVRLSFVVLSQHMSLAALKVSSIPAAILAISLWVIFVMGWRKTGLETQGAPIWWNALRPVHGTLWAFIAYYGWQGDREKLWRLLLLDVCIGLVSFLIFHGILS